MEYPRISKEYWWEALDRLDLIRFATNAPEPLRFQAELLILEVLKLKAEEPTTLGESEFMTAHLVLVMEFMDLMRKDLHRPNWRTGFFRLFSPAGSSPVRHELEFPFHGEEHEEALRLEIYRRLQQFLQGDHVTRLPNLVIAKVVPDLRRRTTTEDGSRWPLRLFEVLIRECPHWNLAYMVLGIGRPFLTGAQKEFERDIEIPLADLYADLRQASSQAVQAADVEILARLYTPKVNRVRVLQEVVASYLNLALSILLDDNTILTDPQGRVRNEQALLERVTTSEPNGRIGKRRRAG
ncbi:MAG: hypothetical protein AAFQ98_10415 [Bacteroidota bacterium]